MQSLIYVQYPQPDIMKILNAHLAEEIKYEKFCNMPSFRGDYLRGIINEIKSKQHEM